MVYLVLASHGNLAEGMLNSVQLLAGPQKNISTVTLKPGNNIEVFAQKLSDEIKKHISQNKQVLVLTDMFGGSPTNSALIALQNLDFKCITGMNLPMVLEAVLDQNQNYDFNKYLNKVKEAGNHGIIDLNQKVALAK
ncbi:PTS sugar transporter subunit IIA [Lactobacillus amylovorus]|jgi:PTS system mannose-specific IIA component|uniref:PTS sugar transporter subunit IIA n=1 Tax=Lactobacillus amylovorus TaxID=1604 RepID=A0AAW6B9B7_LACAM|nr:PTS sugar transporter subunit IIA [Lactobacillus amylovorus]MDA6089258.1 PTS sugar transporter subunit IIA [Lactobacillus amylovorus]MDB6246528.1 PTS sugar transporter subunit IIA [Lactobacillus amylovorus]